MRRSIGVCVAHDGARLRPIEAGQRPRVRQQLLSAREQKPVHVGEAFGQVLPVTEDVDLTPFGGRAVNLSAGVSPARRPRSRATFSSRARVRLSRMTGLAGRFSYSSSSILSGSKGSVPRDADGALTSSRKRARPCPASRSPGRLKKSARGPALNCSREAATCPAVDRFRKAPVISFSRRGGAR